MTKIFVYGSLRKNEPLSIYMEVPMFETEYIGLATIEGLEMYTNNYYPYVVNGEGTVTGEVYECGDEIVNLLDGIEHEYNRELRIVTYHNGEKEPVNVYIFNKPVTGNMKKINSGDWKIQNGNTN